MDRMEKEENSVMVKSVNDGIVETIIGMILVLLGVRIFNEFLYNVATFSFLIVLFIKPLKRMITYPRIGYFKIASVKQRKTDLLILIGVNSILMTGVAVFFVKNARDFVSVNAVTLFSFLFAIVAVAVYLITKIKRFLIYGVISITLVISFGSMRHGIDLAFLATGVILLITGIIIMIRFMKKNPKLPRSDYVRGNS